MKKEIYSKDNKEIKYLTRLYQDKKFRKDEGVFIIEGYNLIEEAKNAGILKNIYTIKPEKDYKDATIISLDLMKKICDSITPQGIIGVCESKLKSSLGDKVLYLDHIQDPGNLGTLLRSARAFKFDTIVLDNCVDLFNPKTVRSSEGNLFHLNFYNISIDELIKKDYKVLATSMYGVKLETFHENYSKVCLVLGNEGNGVSDSILKKSYINLTISMNETESLNVGVAGAIIMHHLTYNIKDK